MNKDNKAIFESFARSRQQIVSEMTPDMSPYDQFRQMYDANDGSLEEHLRSIGDSRAVAEYMNEVKEDYDARNTKGQLGIPSDDPDSPFAHTEDMARAQYADYDNQKNSIIATAKANPAAAGPELDSKDEEAPVVSQDDKPEDPDWAALGAKEIPPIPPGADTPGGGAPSEPAPPTDMTGVEIPGVNNAQGASQLSSEPNDPVVAQSGVEDIEPGTVPPVAMSADQPIKPGEANTAPVNPDGSSSITSLPTSPDDDLDLGVDLPEDPTISATFDAGGDPTDSISRDYVDNNEYAGENETPRTIDGEPAEESDPNAGKFWDGQKWVSNTTDPESAAPALPSMDTASLSPARPSASIEDQLAAGKKRAEMAGIPTDDPKIPTDPERSTGTGAYDWIKKGMGAISKAPRKISAGNTAMKDYLAGVKDRSDKLYADLDGNQEGLPPGVSSYRDINPWEHYSKDYDPKTGERKLEEPTRPSQDELEQMERETGLRPAFDGDVASQMSPGPEDAAGADGESEPFRLARGPDPFKVAAAQAKRREGRKAIRARDKKHHATDKDNLNAAIANAQTDKLASNAFAYADMDLDELYAAREKMRDEHQKRRFKRQDARQGRRDRKAARNNPGGEETGVAGPAGPAGEQDTPIAGGQREDGYSSADITDADLEGQYVDAELDGNQGALADGSISDEEAARINAGLDDAAAATQTTPSRPLSTPEPEATAQKPGLGRKLMSFLPGGEKPSEVWGKHAGREGINAKVRGANNTTSFKDYNAARNAEQQASAQREADRRVAAKKASGTLNKPKPAPGGLSRTTDKKPPQSGQTTSATPADSQKKKGGFFSGFKAKDPGKPAGRIKSVRDR